MKTIRLINIALTVGLLVSLAQFAKIFAYEKETAPPARKETAVDQSYDIKKIVENLGLASTGKKMEKTAVLAPARGDITLSGVFANETDPKLSRAIVKTEEKGQFFVSVGDEIAPGAVLESVEAGRVIINRAGVREEVKLAEFSTEPSPSVGVSDVPDFMRREAGAAAEERGGLTAQPAAGYGAHLAQAEGGAEEPDFMSEDTQGAGEGEVPDFMKKDAKPDEGVGIPDSMREDVEPPSEGSVPDFMKKDAAPSGESAPDFMSGAGG